MNHYIKKINDILRELRIAYWRFRMEHAESRDEYSNAWLKLKFEVAARSRAQVARMERKKGLA